MFNRIILDLDNVLRDTQRHIIGNVNEWDEANRIVEAIENDLTLLCRIPPTEYLSIVLDNVPRPIQILTCQHVHWMPYTKMWLDKYLGLTNYECRIVSKIKDKLGLLKTDDLLVDDYPKFGKYDQIALIDYKYNSNIEAFSRIRTPEELKSLIDAVY